MATTIELYTMLKDKLGDVETRALVETIEDTPRRVKDELLKDFATKADNVRLEGKIEKLEEKMDGQFKNVRLEIKMVALLLAFLIILTNPKALDIISKLFGLVK
jgi:hypothetical protein